MVAYVVLIGILLSLFVGTFRGYMFNSTQFLQMVISMGITTMLISACAIHLMKMQRKIFKTLSFLVLIPTAFLIPHIFSLWAYAGWQVFPNPYPWLFTVTVLVLTSFALSMWAVKNQPKNIRIITPLAVLVPWIIVFAGCSFYLMVF